MHKNIIYREIGRDPMYKLWHTAADNMIIYINSDGGSIVLDDKIYPMRNGSLCFIGAEKYRYTMPIVPESYVRSKLFISPEESLKILSAFLTPPSFLKSFSPKAAVYAEIPPKRHKEVEDIFALADSAKEDPEHFYARLACCYVNLLIELDLYAAEHTAPMSDFITSAIGCINENISHTLTLDTLCRNLHVSKYHFCRKFKAAIGLTPMEYILKTRLMLAKNALADTSLTISEVSSACGFSSLSYFCRVFKADAKKTPLEYRRELVPPSGKE